MVYYSSYVEWFEKNHLKMRVCAPPLSSTEFSEIFEKNHAGTFKNTCHSLNFEFRPPIFIQCSADVAKKEPEGADFFWLI